MGSINVEALVDIEAAGARLVQPSVGLGQSDEMVTYSGILRLPLSHDGTTEQGMRAQISVTRATDSTSGGQTGIKRMAQTLLPNLAADICRGDTTPPCNLSSELDNVTGIW